MTVPLTVTGMKAYRFFFSANVLINLQHSSNIFTVQWSSQVFIAMEFKLSGRQLFEFMTIKQCYFLMDTLKPQNPLIYVNLVNAAGLR